ncbi:hypothetical protein HMPREF9946_02540 [Acetobacteraceae bacterium AT-5844]|nr:hypothetical protein HMPREF9946_02540 [Acetobacteraceae bacterium AT-5844]
MAIVCFPAGPEGGAKRLSTSLPTPVMLLAAPAETGVVGGNEWIRLKLAAPFWAVWEWLPLVLR